MLDLKNQERCSELLDEYGPWSQLMMVIEECSELQKECCKIFRNRHIGDPFGPSLEVIEELVDVIVMCEQLRLMCGLTSEQINELAAQKLERAYRKSKIM